MYQSDCSNIPSFMNGFLFVCLFVFLVSPPPPKGWFYVSEFYIKQLKKKISFETMKSKWIKMVLLGYLLGFEIEECSIYVEK